MKSAGVLLILTMFLLLGTAPASQAGPISASDNIPGQNGYDQSLLNMINFNTFWMNWSWMGLDYLYTTHPTSPVLWSPYLWAAFWFDQWEVMLMQAWFNRLLQELQMQQVQQMQQVTSTAGVFSSTGGNPTSQTPGSGSHGSPAEGGPSIPPPPSGPPGRGPSATPAPSTLVLAGMGILGAGGYGWRARRKAVAAAA